MSLGSCHLTDDHPVTLSTTEDSMSNRTGFSSTNQPADRSKVYVKYLSLLAIIEADISVSDFLYTSRYEAVGGSNDKYPGPRDGPFQAPCVQNVRRPLQWPTGFAAHDTTLLALLDRSQREMICKQDFEVAANGNERKDIICRNRQICGFRKYSIIIICPSGHSASPDVSGTTQYSLSDIPGCIRSDPITRKCPNTTL
jgi:hypothetical protein